MFFLQDFVETKQLLTVHLSGGQNPDSKQLFANLNYFISPIT